MEDGLKIFKIEYINEHCSGDQTEIKNVWNEVDIELKKTSKY